MREHPRAYMIYNLVGRITAGGTNLWSSSAEQIAKHFDWDYDHTCDEIAWLRKEGWLELHNKDVNKHAVKKYLYRKHEEWVEAHPGCTCHKREVLAWDNEEHEKFGQALFAVSGVPWTPNLIKAAYKLHGGDQEIAKVDFTAFVAGLKYPPKTRHAWLTIRTMYAASCKKRLGVHTEPAQAVVMAENH
jgi:hypothetical protein